MAEFHLVEIADISSWAGRAYHALAQQITMEIHGEDQAGSWESVVATSVDSAARINGVILAVAGRAPTTVLGRFGLPSASPDPVPILGSVTVSLPRHDNLHLLEDVFVQVAAPHRRLGIGSALLAAAIDVGSRYDRNTVLMWSDHSAAEGLGVVHPAHGGSGVPRDAATIFAQHHGFNLAQVERQSRLALPMGPRLLADLAAASRSVAQAGYRLVSWSGATPPEHLDAVAEAQRAISADAPTGEIRWETERWDADRVREGDQRLARAGTAFRTLAFTHAGAPAGLSTIFVENGPPVRAYQFDTVVLRGHRGHRLGMWMKLTNLEAVTAARPELSHLDTWNADENQHMLAINTAMGYRLWSINGGWQRLLD